MPKRSVAPVRPKIAEAKNQVPSADAGTAKLNDQLLVRLKAERAACWLVLEQRTLQRAFAYPYGGKPIADMGVEASMLRLRDIDEEICIAGGRSLADDGLP